MVGTTLLTSTSAATHAQQGNEAIEVRAVSGVSTAAANGVGLLGGVDASGAAWAAGRPPQRTHPAANAPSSRSGIVTVEDWLGGIRHQTVDVAARIIPSDARYRSRAVPSSMPFVASRQPVPPSCAGDPDLIGNPGRNLIGNPGFEAGEDGWYVEGATEIVDSDPHGGRFAMRLGSDSEDGYADHRVPDVPPGFVYALSGWGKVSADGESGGIGIVYRNGDGERLEDEEPAALSFSDTEFEQQTLTFVPPEKVTEVSVFLYKAAGAAQFYADTLSLTACGEPSEGPTLTPAVSPPAAETSEPTVEVEAGRGSPGRTQSSAESSEATVEGPGETPSPSDVAPTEVPTKVPTETPTEISTEVPTEVPTAVPTEVPTATSSTAPFTEYVDDESGYTIAYPNDWARLTSDQIQAQLEVPGAGTLEEALTNMTLVVVSPDGEALFAIAEVPLPEETQVAVDIVAQQLQARAASEVSGFANPTERRIELDGADAVELRYIAVDVDVSTGTLNTRAIQHVVTLVDTQAIVLTFITNVEDADGVQPVFEEIKASWQRP